MSNFSKSEKEIYELRKQKIAFLNDISSDSFPTKFNESTKISNIINEHRDIEEGIHTGISVTVRGRLLNARSFGKLLFYDILDQSGKIQLLVNSGEIEDVYLRLFENFDIGDIIAVNGEVIKTKKGELSIKVNQSTILSKSLRSFPEKWHGLKDKETRFRQRYLDLIVNPESKKILETRSKVIKLIREYLHENSFVEVETPILQTKAGGAIAKPFTTHHNALGLDMYLRIAPELYLKRLIIGGFEKVFELGKIFRNEEQRLIVAEQMRESNIDPLSILLEPFKKNTAPAITLAAIKALQKEKDPILLILSSDHNIKDEEKFLETKVLIKHIYQNLRC